MGALAFTAPLVLIALAALPLIWWLLRITPPRPEKEVFPPFRILLALARREETPSTTPWWLLALRLLLAAALIVALAGPLLNPNVAALGIKGPLAIVFDNSWASAPSFEKRRHTAEGLIREAGDRDLPVSLVFTADNAFDAAFKQADDALKMLAAAKPVPKDLSGVGRILFVEDEQIVRGIAAHLLRQRGYEVLEAEDGEEALAIIEAEEGRFDLLISDVIMPGMDGPSMLKLARPILGDVPVMFISGYAESEFSDLLEAEQNISFLPKPLDIKTLAERVKEQLAA